MVNAATIGDETTNGRLNLTMVTADLNVPTFSMSNRSYKVALMSTRANIAAANPWGDPACVDLTSAINTSGADSIDAAKGTADLAAVNAATGGSSTISKQRSWRRTSLTNTGSTLSDFRSIHYVNVDDADMAKFRPRATSNGAWNPGF
jgi:hypothetical protein